MIERLGDAVIEPVKLRQFLGWNLRLGADGPREPGGRRARPGSPEPRRGADADGISGRHVHRPRRAVRQPGPGPPPGARPGTGRVAVRDLARRLDSGLEQWRAVDLHGPLSTLLDRAREVGSP